MGGGLIVGAIAAALIPSKSGFEHTTFLWPRIVVGTLGAVLGAIAGNKLAAKLAPVRWSTVYLKPTPDANQHESLPQLAFLRSYDAMHGEVQDLVDLAPALKSF